MRVALLATEIDFARPAGGAARYAIDVWRMLSARGHDVRLLCYGPRSPSDPPGVERVAVGRIPVWRALAFSRAAELRLAHWQPDVVLANYPLLARHLEGFPVVTVLHSTMRGLAGAAAWGPRGLAERLARRFLGQRHERAALLASRALVCVSEHVAQDVRASGLLPAPPVHVIPGGVDTTRFAPPASRPPGPPFRLLCVGRLIALKRIDLAIAAFEHLRASGVDATLAIAGDGPERPRLLRLIHRSPVRDAIALLGALEGVELARCYAEAHALLLPSRHEGLPLVALEAMASALPVIATAFPGAAALVGTTARGALVEGDTPRDLARTLGAAFADPTWLDRGAHARTWVQQRYAWEAIVTQLEPVLHEAMDPGRRDPR